MAPLFRRLLAWTLLSFLPLASSASEACKFRLVRYSDGKGTPAWGMDITMKDDIPKTVIHLDPEQGFDFQEDTTEIFLKESQQKICVAAGIAKKNPGLFSEQQTILKPSQILPPLPQPKNILAVGMNYTDHNDEVDQSDTVYFSKNVAVTGPYADIIRPNGALLDWEVELGVILRKSIPRDTKITQKNISDYVAGFVLANDVTNRIPIIADTESGFSKGKTEATFLPVGPYFVYIESFSASRQVNPNLKMQTTINSKLKQRSNTNQMLNTLPKIIVEIFARHDQIWVDAKGQSAPLLKTPNLNAGDLILTGTPAGTAIQAPDLSAKLGLALGGLTKMMNPRDVFKQNEYCSGKYLRSGDIVSIEIERLGKQKNLVRGPYKSELAVDCRANGRKFSRLYE